MDKLTIVAIWIILALAILAWNWIANQNAEVEMNEYDEDDNEIIPSDKRPDYEKMFDRIFDGLKWVESSNDPSKIGDQGRALGILQIRKEYFMDAINEALREGCAREGVWYYDTVMDAKVSKSIMKWYFKRQIRLRREKGYDWLTEQDLVRIHNGGPKGHLKDHTWEYYGRYLYYRNILDNGFEIIEGSPMVMAVEGNSKNLPIGELIKATDV